MGSHGEGKPCATCLNKKGKCECKPWTYEDLLENVKKTVLSINPKLHQVIQENLDESGEQVKNGEKPITLSMLEATFLTSCIEMFMDATVIRKMLPPGLWEALLQMASSGEEVETQVYAHGPGEPPEGLEDFLESMMRGGGGPPEDPIKKAARTGKAVIGNPWDAIDPRKKGH